MVNALLDRPFVALLKRELVSQLRTVRAFLLLCLTMGGLIFILGSRWRIMGTTMGGGVSVGLLAIFQLALSWVAFLFVPLLASTTINIEWHKKTMEHLLLTTLGPRAIVLGKALSVFGYFFFILVALFPVAGVVFFLVGIEWSEFLTVVVRQSLLAFMGAMVGVACSARFTRSLSAVIIALVVIYFCNVVASSILFSIYTIGLGSIVIYGLCVAVPTALALFSAGRQLKRAGKPKSRFLQLMETPVGGDSPVLTRSLFRRKGRGKLTLSRKLVWMLSVLCVVIFGFAASGMRDAWEIWLVIEGVMLVFLSTSSIATQLTKEYEQNTLDMLRMTLLRPFSMVAGKLLSGAASLMPIYFGVAFSAAVLLSQAHARTAPILAAHFFLVSFVLASMCAVQFVSLSTRRSSVALVLGYGLNAATLIAFIIAGSLVFNGRGAFHSDAFLPYIIGGLVCLVTAALLLLASTYRYKTAHGSPRSLRSRLRMRWAAPLLVLGLLCGCSGESRQVVVVYTALDEMYSRPILDTFEERTGMEVKAVYDTEAAKTTGLVTRLMGERDRPRADVFWNNEVAQTILLKNKGVLAPYRSAAAEAIPGKFKDGEGYWTGFAARGRVIIYNTELTDAPPTSIEDFVKAEWSGKVAMALPLFGTTATHAAALFADWGEDEAEDFFKKLTANNVAILPGNATVRDRVAQGDFVAGLTDTDDANGGVQDGYPVKWLFPDQDGLGTLVIPNTVCLVAGAPNPEGGKKLIDYLLSAEVEARLAQGRSLQMPLNPGVEAGGSVPRLEDIKTMPVSFEAIAEKMEAAADAARAEFLK